MNPLRGHPSHSDHSLTTNTTQRLSEDAAAIVASHAKQGKYTHVVAANSVFSRDALIRAAALNGHQPISDVTSFESEDGECQNISIHYDLYSWANMSSLRATNLRRQRSHDGQVQR